MSKLAQQYAYGTKAAKVFVKGGTVKNPKFDNDGDEGVQQAQAKKASGKMAPTKTLAKKCGGKVKK